MSQPVPQIHYKGTGKTGAQRYNELDYKYRHPIKPGFLNKSGQEKNSGWNWMRLKKA